MLPRVLLELGFIKIYTFGFTVALGIIVGTYTAFRLADRKKISRDVIIDTLLYGIIAGFIGARLIYIILNLPEYMASPMEIFHVNAGGMSLHGGLLGGLLVVIYQGRKNKLSFWRILDILSPAAALAIAIGRIGCDLYGIPTELPWGIYYQGVRVHPIQAYSFLFNMGLFIYLWKSGRKKSFNGSIFLKFIIIYSVFRFFIEYVRGGYFIWGLFNAGQITSILLLIAGSLLYWIWSKRLEKSKIGNR